MKKLIFIFTLITAMLLAGCAKDNTDYENLRELSWKGKELTISLGENKTTECNWTTKSQDDKVIDYSINRVFHLSDKGAKEGQAYGRLDAGFEGKGEGTTTIVCTTPVDWEGNAPGYTYTVTVTVDADGNIVSATGE